MLRPNQNCTIQLASGDTDIYGKPLPGRIVSERCAVVKDITEDVKSSIRSDSSASRGNAHEFEHQGVILLTKVTAAKAHDIITVRGRQMEIMSMHRRYTVTGALDHYECTTQIWTEA